MATVITEDVLRDRFRGCLVGLAVGDALGMPVETMTRDEIIAIADQLFALATEKEKS